MARVQQLREAPEARHSKRANKEEKDRLDADYNFAYMEIKLIGKELGKVPNEFPGSDDGIQRFAGGDKAYNIEWIGAKLHAIKLRTFQTQRSQTEQLQLKMNKVKKYQ
jgi:hypothetical protein